MNWECMIDFGIFVIREKPLCWILTHRAFYVLLNDVFVPLKFSGLLYCLKTTFMLLVLIPIGIFMHLYVPLLVLAQLFNMKLAKPGIQDAYHGSCHLSHMGLVLSIIVGHTNQVDVLLDCDIVLMRN
ncbi:hypothetical protein SAY86_015309 [Trapa natans]|uniref:Uncharacterized protein n=1 Tax=Trapa natans TaxID=22666 RepID=A0AAN7KHS5_TRANT|nr:hypothetical protein SAY86_015309 [Trapa natans]